ncbi:MAG TPA: amidase [Caulobacteraceae bacterium]|jgi:amidase|nr:amidase [Caulobacteraceae bacterium]
MDTDQGESAGYDVVEASIETLSADMAAGRVTAEALVAAYAARIQATDWAGPALRSVICLNPRAGAEARARDAERAAGQVRGPLHGVPLLIKDNIETDDGTPTTAGSLALARNVTLRDAPAVRRLKDAGAVVLGKTNLSEWANIRSPHSISGWSAVGGLVKNPYALDRSAAGSSSGSGAAIAASLAAAAVGTETDGSVTAPASYAALVGLKPTLGLISRTHVVPISHTQDTPGPMCRSVRDAAILLTAMAGADPADPDTAEADARRCDYVAALAGATLAGKRLGVLRYACERMRPALAAVFDAALALLRRHGAELVELADWRPPEALGRQEHLVLLTELKADLGAYLATTPPQVACRTLADVIAFNRSSPRELVLFGQEMLEEAEATRGLDDPAYIAARDAARLAAGPDGIDRLLGDHRLEALIAPSYGPASRIDVPAGEHGWGRTSGLPAIAGYPHLTVPMGQVRGLPVGLSFVGAAWSEAALLRLGYAFEQAAQARRPPTYRPSVEDADDLTAAFAPAP